MRRTVLVFLMLLVAVAPALVRGAAPADRPNVILINIDDLGSRELGSWGGRFRTPALDRMAAEGRRMTDHYAAPVCSPSRAAPGKRTCGVGSTRFG
jgi:arylsulfatase A